MEMNKFSQEIQYSEIYEKRETSDKGIPEELQECAVCSAPENILKCLIIHLI